MHGRHTGYDMNIEKFHKQEIAARQLQTALRLFFAGGDVFSVITLAGAAEEILAGLLEQKRAPEKGGFRSVLQLLRPAKRGVEDGLGGNWHETDLYVHMDARQEARFLLEKAIDGYLELFGELTAEMTRYNEEVRGKG